MVWKKYFRIELPLQESVQFSSPTWFLRYGAYGYGHIIIHCSKVDVINDYHQLRLFLK